MNFSRPVWVEVSLDNIKHNVTKVAGFISRRTKVMAVVKANAYGHGLVEVARACIKSQPSRVVFLGVSSVEEGISIRRAKIKSPVLILGTLYPFESFKEVLKHSLVPTVASVLGLKVLDGYARKLNRVAPFHLKVDTGMGRIGISPDAVKGFLRNMEECRNVRLEGVFTHFAAADSDDAFTKEQIRLFDGVVGAVKEGASAIKGMRFNGIEFHAASSSAIIKFPESHYSMVRPGLCLYGLLPFPGSDSVLRTKPALSWKTKVVFVKRMPAGARISYGGTFVTKRPSIIATIPVGYGDGYSRKLSNKGCVLIKGRRAPVVGRITMDMSMIDVTGIPPVVPGDEVTVAGLSGVRVGSARPDAISIEEIAGLCETINYEVTCNIHPRVPRIWTSLR